MSEVDSPRTTFLFVSVIGGVILTTVLVLGVYEYVSGALRDEVSRKQLQPEASALRLLRAEEQAKLTHYQWVDQKAGVVRIPVEKAMALVLAEWPSRPSGFGPGAPDLTPAAPAAPAAPGAAPAPAAPVAAPIAPAAGGAGK